MTPGFTGSRGAKDRGVSVLNSYPSSRGIINPPQNDRYWWSWRRCRHLVKVIKERGIETPAEWHRLARIFQSVSIYKKAYLRRELMDALSQASLDFLFGVSA